MFLLKIILGIPVLLFFMFYLIVSHVVNRVAFFIIDKGTDIEDAVLKEMEKIGKWIKE